VFRPLLSDELGSSRPNTPDSAFDSSLTELVGAEGPVLETVVGVVSTAGATRPEGRVLEAGVGVEVGGATVTAAADGVDLIVVAGLFGADELTGLVPVVDDVGVECLGAAPAEAGGVELDAESECVPAGLVGGVRCLVGPPMFERVVGDPDAVLVLVLADGVLPVLPVAVLAWAIPDPLASAAPTPRVRAPAPSQVDVWLRRCSAARWRPFLRLVVRLALFFARFPFATAGSPPNRCFGVNFAHG
jgi:hypothetical protein